MLRSELDRRLAALVGGDVLAGVAPISEWAQAASSIHPSEAACVSRAVPKRQREFAIGRSLARKLVFELGVDALPLLPDSDRCPIWPPRLIGSISHTSKICAVVVASEKSLRGVGIDVELAEPLPENLHTRICLPDELDDVKGECAGRRAKLLFSIKEAVYKCQFPITRIPFEFHDVRVELQNSQFLP